MLTLRAAQRALRASSMLVPRGFSTLQFPGEVRFGLRLVRCAPVTELNVA